MMVSTANKILSEIFLYYDDGAAEQPIWTCHILSRQTRISLQDVNAALIKLQTDGLLYRHKGEYRITDAGKEHYRDMLTQPRVVANLQAWKAEVLSGMKANGQQTTIEHAALPRTLADERREQSPEVRVMRAQEDARAQRAIAAELGIGPREYERRMKDESIRPCRGYDGTQHIGIFHRRHRDKPGWQDLCSRCRKRRRGDR